MIKDTLYGLAVYIPLLMTHDTDEYRIITIGIIVGILLVLGVLPYLLSGKCFLEVLINKHPIRNLKFQYKNYKIVYFIIPIIFCIFVLEYLISFNIIKI
jgi:hypothetical protein